MSLVEFAKMELSHVPDDDWMKEDILAMVELFASQGHSGMSARYAIEVTSKLLRYEALSPLTGADDEWVTLDYNDDMAAQNKRCSHVFRRRDGTAYDIEGYIFRDPDGNSYTSSGSRREVLFPYTPVREYVDVDNEGNPIMSTTSQEIASLAGSVLSGHEPSRDEILKLAGSALEQREKPTGPIHPAPSEFTDKEIASDPMLRYFHYAHLPEPLRAVSESFCTLARFIVDALPRNPERTVALRKLLEAKDAGVRANLPAPKPKPVDAEFPIEGEVVTTGGDKSEEPIPFR